MGFASFFCVAFSYEIKLELLWILCLKFSNNMSSINFDFLISFQIDFFSTLLTDTSWETNIYSVIYLNVSKYLPQSLGMQPPRGNKLKRTIFLSLFFDQLQSALSKTIISQLLSTLFDSQLLSKCLSKSMKASCYTSPLSCWQAL